MSDKHLRMTGKIIRMCDCGCEPGKAPKDVAPCLPVYTDGTIEYAHCDKCWRTWRLDTMEEIPCGLLWS